MRKTLNISFCLMLCLVICAVPAFAGKKATKIDTPILACGSSTQASLNVIVTAGATGLPAGFSLQWMTAADYAANANQWYSSDDARLCKASFSGNASGYFYSLNAGQSSTVELGDILFDNPGASTNCDQPLVCGTEYVIRSFGHATSTLFRSDFTSNLNCSTLPCGHEDSCTLTQGYWKTHGPIPTGNNTNVWPAAGLTLGNVFYTQLELQAIFNAKPAGNGLISLAHQLIAAKLNVANGADATDVADAIAAADALIGDLVVPPVGSGSLAPEATSILTGTLDSYNKGVIGPGHCD